MRERGQSFVGGAAALMMAALTVKLIGALFKIPLTELLGGSGMGYFMTAFGLFNPIYALSAAGFPVAVSKLTAQSIALGRREEAGPILMSALAVFMPAGLLLAGAMYVGAPVFATAVGNPLACRAVRAIAPAVLFISMSSVLRGSFEGRRNMIPTAVSQVLEAMIKLLVGIFLATHCVKLGYAQFALDKIVFGVPVHSMTEAGNVIAPMAAAAAIGGVTISTAFGSLYMALRTAVSERCPSRVSLATSSRGYAMPLLCFALPVCLGALVVNLTSLIDLMSVMNRLRTAAQRDLPRLIASHPLAALGSMPAEAIPNFLYGSYTGLAVTIMSMVPAVTASLGISALPMISALHARGQRARLRMAIESVLRVTAMAAFPAGIGICCLSGPILTLLFGSNPAEVAVAAPLLQTLGISVIFIAMAAPISSMLQAVGRIYTPVLLMLVGSGIKLAANFMLMPLPSINIKGAPLGTLLCYLILFLGGFSALMREVGADVNLAGLCAKPLVGALCCGVVARSAYTLLYARWEHAAAVLPAIAVGGISYLVVLLRLHAFDEQDWALLSGKSKFAQLLAKQGRVR